MNSILAHIESNVDDKTATVMQMLNHVQTKDKLLILVEGEDDESFYGNYLDASKVFLYALNGCQYFVNVLHILNPRFKRRLAAIKDADFDHLNGICYEYDNLFLTDFHDYEMLIMSSERVAKVASEYGLDDQSAASVYDVVVNNISNFSFVKWHNSRRASGVKGISFNKSKAIHHFGKSVSESVDILRPLQDEDVNIDVDGIMALKNDNTDVEIRQLINGHDFCQIIPKVIKDIKKVNIRNKDIPVKLVSFFSKSDFSKTRLAQSMNHEYPDILRP